MSNVKQKEICKEKDVIEFLFYNVLEAVLKEIKEEIENL